MAIVLRIPGVRVDSATVSRGAARPSVVTTDSSSTLLKCVAVLDVFEVSAASRSQSAAVETVEMDEDDILEVEFEDGTSVYTSVRKYSEEMEWLAPEAKTAGAIDWRPWPAAAASERGIVDWGVTRLKRLRLKADDLIKLAGDPSRWPSEMPRWLHDAALNAAGKVAGWLLIQALTWLIERQLTPGPGFYRWPIVNNRPSVDFQSLSPAGLTSAPQGPLLVCIHGTGSSSVGSFRQLFVQDVGKDQSIARPEWSRLERQFGDNIFAFEHRTLSESPIDNAIQLAEWLPAGAEIRLLSHSRGGLVGDLLCLPGIPQAWRDEYRRPASWGMGAADSHDREQLARLDLLLRDKNFQITHFARVACPARGTLLASENLEKFLSSLTRWIGLIPGVGTSLTFDIIKRVTLEVVRARANPYWIPGIESMAPSSPLVRMLNAAAHGTASTTNASANKNRTLARGRLGIVAGDCDGGGLVRRALTTLNDWIVYHGRENDWIVNTDSMFEGALREQAPSHYVFDRGGDVSHFAYFANDRTREAVADWLTQAIEPEGVEYRPPRTFAKVTEDRSLRPLPRSASRTRAPEGNRPRVVVIPGIMGSHLSKNGKRIWLDFFELIQGNITELDWQVRAPSTEAEAVRPDTLLESYYGQLCEFLGQSHDVVAFPYDWRQSLSDLGTQLADKVELMMREDPHRPIRFLAHSMGGLVARSMILNGQSKGLWEKLCRSHDARLLMLGTPNHGSHAIVGMLTGFDSLARRLALLDFKNDLNTLLKLVAGFPGVLELLPRDDAWWKAETWQSFRLANRDTGAVPTEELLAAARKCALELNHPLPHSERILYVAGQAPSTLSNARIERNRLVFDTTSAGDGRVTHAAGRLPGVATWYVDAQHGDLPSHFSAFAAYEELLERGTTAGLAQSASSTRDAAVGRIDQPPTVLFPTERELLDDVLGRRMLEPKRAASRGLSVEIVHGDLCYAKYPVMVGHFAGDTLTGPEAVLDSQLRGMLSQRHRFGVYPGAWGTTYTALRGCDANEKRLPGAIVIGLGQMGELSPAVLANSIRDGVLDYVMTRAAIRGLSPEGDAPRVGVGLSMLLVGSASASLLTVEDSVSAILRGVAAASREVERHRCPVYLDNLEIVELFADSIIEAARAVAQLAPAISREFEIRLDFSGQVKQGQGRRQRLWSREGRNKWHRWAISSINPPNTAQTLAELPPSLRCALRECLANAAKLDERTYRDLLDLILPNCRGEKSSTIELRFVSVTDRARAERTSQPFQAILVEQLTAELIRDGQFHRDQAVSLGRLLIPNELSETILQNSRLVLAVDENTANYPWEMLILADKPLALQLPLIRQLQTTAIQHRLHSSTGRAAFVVGAPKTPTNVPKLLKAHSEGKRVAKVLEEHGYQVESLCDEPTAGQVLRGLYARPYRIVHIAGHGYQETASVKGETARTGVLLDEGLYLTAVELSKVSQLPHLVFLNCCHLGKLDDGTQGGIVPYNKLAASLSLELIRMGVHAVVAAGWAVEDAAAEVFSTEFYRRLLEGEAFGEAIDGARRLTYERYPASNTWGAYQAYGDPDYRLRANQGEAALGDKMSTRTYYLPEEIIAEIDNLSADAKKAESAADDAEKLHLRERLERIEQDWPAAWRDNPLVKAAFGRAYAEMADWHKAIRFYSSALHSEAFDDNFDVEGSVRFKLVEQLANCEARSRDIDLIKQSIKRLQDLLQVAESSERLALLGSAHKRLADYLANQAPQTADDPLQELDLAAKCYYKAWKRRPEKVYYAQNYLIFRLLASHGEVTSQIKMPMTQGEPDEVEVGECLRRLQGYQREETERESNVWNAITLADLDMLGLLYQHENPKPEQIDEIKKKYEEAFLRFNASARERDSALTNLIIQQRFLRNASKRQAVLNVIKQVAPQRASQLEPEQAPVEQAPTAANQAVNEQRPRRRRRNR